MKPISDKVFWDTNVLVYCDDKNKSERKVKAQALGFELPDIMISTQVLNEQAFVLSKKQGLDWVKVADVLQEVTQNFTIQPNTAETIIKATSMHINTSSRFTTALSSPLPLNEVPISCIQKICTMAS